MDFPQTPQPSAPFPTAPQPVAPSSFPNVTAEPVAAGPMPGPTLPAMPGVSPQPVQIPVQAHGGAMNTDEQVYTMPDKFLNTGAPGGSSISKAKRPNKAVTIILLVVIGLMVLAAIGGVLYYFLVMAKEPVVETSAENAVVVNTAPINNTNNVNNGNTNVNSNAVTNGNTNANGNANANTNSTANINRNTNAANSNAVTNLNSNANVNTNANANANTNSTATVPLPGKDTDEDSLTNDEEQIWSTKADLPDTDSDGYADGVEILAGYDPTNPTSSGRLAGSSLAGTFSNTAYHYTMLYPKNWLAEALAEGGSTEVLFTPNTLDLTGQFVGVTITENPTGLTALDWYSQTASLDEDQIETIASFTGLAGVMSTDATTVYYADSNYIYAISYHYATSDELYFPTTFTLMAKSFVLVSNAN